MNSTMDKLLRPQTAQEAVRDLGCLEEVTLFGAQVYEFVEAATQSAPYLRVLVLDPYEFHKSRKRGHKCSRTGMRPNFLIPFDIFATGKLPCLLDLTLSNLRIDPNSPLFSANLTSLTLGRAREDHDCCFPRIFSLPLLIEVLRRTPLLTEFVMIDILTEPSPTFSKDLAQIMPVNLRHLKVLDFHGFWIDNYRWFMQKLDYTPSLLTIEMMTRCNATEIWEQNNVLQLVPFDIASSIGEIEVSKESSSFKVSGWRREAGQRSPHATFSATIRPEKSSALALSQGVFAFFAEHRPSLLSLEDLRFSWNKASSGPAGVSVDWAPLLWMLPGLRSITADYTTPGRDCIDIAGALAANTTVSGNTEFTCTNLRRLEFQSVVLEDCLAEFLEVLASVLELRHRHNINCEELWIGNSDKGIPCNAPTDFEALRRKRKQDLIQAPVRSR